VCKHLPLQQCANIYLLQSMYTRYSKYSFYTQRTNGWHWMQYKKSVTEQTLASWTMRSSTVTASHFGTAMKRRENVFLTSLLCKILLPASNVKHVKWGTVMSRLPLTKHLIEAK
jgi:hypothetical protein